MLALQWLKNALWLTLTHFIKLHRNFVRSTGRLCWTIPKPLFLHSWALLGILEQGIVFSEFDACLANASQSMLTIWLIKMKEGFCWYICCSANAVPFFHYGAERIIFRSAHDLYWTNLSGIGSNSESSSSFGWILILPSLLSSSKFGAVVSWSICKLNLMESMTFKWSHGLTTTIDILWHYLVLRFVDSFRGWRTRDIGIYHQICRIMTRIYKVPFSMTQGRVCCKGFLIWCKATLMVASLFFPVWSLLVGAIVVKTQRSSDEKLNLGGILVRSPCISNNWRDATHCSPKRKGNTMCGLKIESISLNSTLSKSFSGHDGVIDHLYSTYMRTLFIRSIQL